jgi:hypothetical protein
MVRAVSIMYVRSVSALGNYIERMSVLRQAFSSSPEVSGLAARFDSQVNVARSVIFSSSAVNLADGVVLPGLPVEGPGDWHKQGWNLEFFNKLDDRLRTGPVPLDKITDNAWRKISDNAWRVVDVQWP